MDLPAYAEGGFVHVVVEVPRGSSVKLKLDPKLEAFAYSRTLPLGVSYPADFGFVPSTKADDGDPIDVMVLHDAATYPGVVIPCRLLGALQVSQTEKGKAKRGRNDRLIAIPYKSDRYADIDDLPAELREALERFFLISVMNTGKHVRFEGWHGQRFAKEAVERARKRYEKRASGR